MATEYKPNYAIHVGVFLKDALEAYGMTQKELSDKIGVSKTIINEIIKGKRGMNAALASSLEPFFGMSAKYWMNIQSDFELAEARADNVLITEDEAAEITEDEEIGAAEYSAMEIAYWFINRANDDVNGEWITPLKLQKLLYFAQAEYLIQTNRALFRENILRWDYGPVVKEVYDAYKSNQRFPITEAPDTHIDTDTEYILKKVYKKYGKYSAGYLVELTHREIAWKETKKDEVIPLQAIKNTFSDCILDF